MATKKPNRYTVQDGIVTMQLTQGEVCTFDEKDLEMLSERCWRTEWNGRHDARYAVTTINRKGVYMQRYLLEEPVGRVDHRDLDTLNNRRKNLRVVTNSQNGIRHKLFSTNTSGYTGVTKNPNGKWNARIFVNGKSIYLGLFEKIEDAAKARRNAEARYFGQEFVNEK